MRTSLAKSSEHVVIPINPLSEMNFKILKVGEFLESLNQTFSSLMITPMLNNFKDFQCGCSAKRNKIKLEEIYISSRNLIIHHLCEALIT
jgi:hypothetical protein